MPRSAVDTRVPTTAMRVTTVRFGHDLWQLLEREAGLVGTSVSQYIREASLARAAATVAVRGEDALEQLAHTERARHARNRAALERDEARALRAESQQAVAEATKKAGRAKRTSRSSADRVPGDRQGS